MVADSLRWRQQLFHYSQVVSIRGPDSSTSGSAPDSNQVGRCNAMMFNAVASDDVALFRQAIEGGADVYGEWAIVYHSSIHSRCSRMS